MFQKNLEAIRSKNPQLAKKLEKIDINSIKGIDVMEAESKDLIIAYKNTPLNSPIDPIREAKTMWNRTIKNELNKNDFQVVFGLGLGYLFKRAYINAESKIILIEPYLEVLRFVLEHVDFSNEFADERVYVTDNLADISDKLNKEYLAGDRVEFLFLNQYAVMNQEFLGHLTQKVFEIIDSRKNDANTIFALSKTWTENFIKNMVNIADMRPLGFLEGAFAGKTALIVSAGPSLAYDIEKIKANEDKFVIIAVGKALKHLAQAGIIPDFTVFADAGFSFKQFEGLESAIEKTNLILLFKSDNNAFNLKSASKILYFSEADSMSGLFKNIGNKNIGFYSAGSSVSIISYYVAKAMGFGKIIFSGLDLAFVDDNNYIGGHNIWKDCIKLIKYSLELKPEIYKIKNKDGAEILKKSDYDWFLKQFDIISNGEIEFSDEYSKAIEAFINPKLDPDIAEMLKDSINFYKFAFQNHEAIYVKDKEGNNILTRSDYAWFIRQFGEIFSEEVNLAKIINTSLKGAYIEGIEYMPLSEVINSISENKPDCEKILSDLSINTDNDWKTVINTAYSRLQDSYQELKAIHQESSDLYRELDNICNTLKETGKLKYTPDAYEALNNNIINVRQKVITHLFLSNSIQKTVWNYTKNYITRTPPTKEDVISNLQLDRDFFKEILKESSDIMIVFGKTIGATEKKCLTA